MDDPNEPPSGVPPAVWQWMCDELGERGARLSDPLVGAVLASDRVEKQARAGGTPPEVLRYWAWFLDGARRTAHQNELQFVRHLRAAGWPDDDIRRWVLLETETDIDAHIEKLDTLVHRTDRPPNPAG